MINKLILRKIKKSDVISFDIFDTLIERNVQKPTDIFEIVGKKFDESNDGFKQERINAELKAREKHGGEVNIDDIYQCLDGYDNESREILKSIELATEIESVYRKESMVDIYETAIANKKVFLISDMYLSVDVIEKMLQKAGVNGYQKIYISNEYGCNKISGKLFDVVIKENRIKRSQMLHIGDSIKADFIGALKSGIHTCLIGRKNRLKRIFS